MVVDIGALSYTPYHCTVNGVAQLDVSLYLNHGHILFKIMRISLYVHKSVSIV